MRREKPRVEKKRKPVMAWALYDTSANALMEGYGTGVPWVFRTRAQALDGSAIATKVVRVRISIVK